MDLYDLTSEQRWLDTASDVTRKTLDVYFDGALPRAATTVEYYESQTRPAYLLYNLIRLAFVERDGIDVGPDYTDR